MEIFREFFLDPARKALTNINDDGYFDGYNEAANICLNQVGNEIEKLHSKISEGQFLNENEQSVLANLTRIRELMINALDKHLE